LKAVANDLNNGGALPGGVMGKALTDAEFQQLREGMVLTAEEVSPRLKLQSPNGKLTGGKVNYYLVKVDHPQRVEQEPYQAECEDIISALGMTFDEGCLFKALWRTAAARQYNGKPGQDPIYDGEKMVHYAGRILKALRIQHA
jgi:hypothetical protein